ncbi:hypothetical protein LEN26_010105 [Aphanomyces euteiches]|nr:hypothetical protein AeMF1_012113 [Aphanomyces euteiches]KAH9122805.1 hypothetical protein LEN26_010105 [Aphanomyces euteiches]
MATEWKAMGNGAFKSKDYTRAQAYYSQALQVLEAPQSCKYSQADLQVLEAPQSCKYSQADLQVLGPVIATMHVNIAACYLQNKDAFDYKLCVDHCTKAIQYDPVNVKAWYRRSQAYAKEKNFASAKQDVLEAIRIDPSNAALRTYHAYFVG